MWRNLKFPYTSRNFRFFDIFGNFATWHFSTDPTGGIGDKYEVCVSSTFVLFTLQFNWRMFKTNSSWFFAIEKTALKGPKLPLLGVSHKPSGIAQIGLFQMDGCDTSERIKAALGWPPPPRNIVPTNQNCNLTPNYNGEKFVLKFILCNGKICSSVG